MAEFVAEQIEGPVGVLASAQRFADQHLMPNKLLFARILLCPRLAAHHEAKSAFLKIDAPSFRLRHPSAVVTGRLDHDGFAGGTLVQSRFKPDLAPSLRRVCGA